MLVAYLSLIAIAVSLFYLIYNRIYAVEDNYIAYYFLLIGGTTSLWLNRNGKHFPAKIVFLTVTNIIVFLFSSQSDFKTDTHFYYLIISISAFALFGYEERWMAFVVAIISIALFAVTFVTGFSPLPDAGYPEHYIRSNQVFNFIIGSSAASMIVYVLVKVNYLSEEALRRKQKEMRLQNQALAKANRELDRFVYSASHDLRAPLTSILGLTNIARQSRDPKEIDQCLDMIASRAHRLDDFIHDIIDFSRNSRTAVRNEEVPVKETINHVLESLKHTAVASPIHFELDILNDLSWRTDAGRLNVILNNLIGNAIKYHDPSKDKSVIKIQALKSNDRYELTVNDNGIGIDIEHQPRIFDMFYRASERSKGSGLGLFIVKETVDKLQGSIILQSQPGEGSTFTIVLPAA
jgi:signal transduction histidine kinase